MASRVTLRVGVDHGNYAVVQDVDGKVTVERHGFSWVEDPGVPKVLVSMAYELAALRNLLLPVEMVLGAKSEAELIGAVEVLRAAYRHSCRIYSVDEPRRIEDEV